MTNHDLLLRETARERECFLALPLIRQALASGGPRELYLDFLAQAYHHVRHTFPLLALAAARTMDEDYQTALFAYMKEERGHEKWILDDINALGGDAGAVEKGRPEIPCQVMVGHAYYVIEHISPLALLGMVHVLEGLSVMLARQAAGAIRESIGIGGAKGFSYLTSHGALDVEHVEMFKGLVNALSGEQTRAIIIPQARVFYRLYGAIFEDLGERHGVRDHAA